MTETLQEAVSYEAFPERVRGLEKGEVARMKDGTAVKAIATEDGRDAWKVGGPSSWNRDGLSWDGEDYRTVAAAIEAAFLRSARSTDPESIGGETRFTKWMPLRDGARSVRLVGVAADGSPLVALASQPEGARTQTTWAALTSMREAIAEAEVGKPGTNWKQVTPENRRRLSGIIRHYMAKPHPFTACVRDNTKRFGAERAKRICAVVKDLGMRSTKWRSQEERDLLRMVDEAEARLRELDEALGEGAAARLAEEDATGEPFRDKLRELAFNDRALLYLAGRISEEEMRAGRVT